MYDPNHSQSLSIKCFHLLGSTFCQALQSFFDPYLLIKLIKHRISQLACSYTWILLYCSLLRLMPLNQLREPSYHRVGQERFTHTIAFFSPKCLHAERKDEVADPELLVISLLLEKQWHLLEGAAHLYIIYTDHRNQEYLARPWGRSSSPDSYHPGSKNGKVDPYLVAQSLIMLHCSNFTSEELPCIPI